MVSHRQSSISRHTIHGNKANQVIKQKKIHIQTLGCPRNQVDSELFHNIASNYGFVLTEKPGEADLLLINTCGFIDSAKAESVDEILQYAEYKSPDAVLMVTGCLAERYHSSLEEEIPEVDYYIGLKDYHTFSKILSKITSSGIHQDHTETRKLIGSEPYSYLKIADGCDNHCSYCVIPSIRGKVKSEPIDKLTAETLFLASQHKKELIITAMDISQYGKDLNDQPAIECLLHRLLEVQGISWIRLLYLHPKGISRSLIRLIRDNPKICNYLDIPLQHINNSILKSMNRKTTKYEIEKLIDMIRTEIPDIALRTTMIVGYPGETETQFNELLKFIEKTKFNRLGAFTYSAEESTPSYSMTNQPPLRTARSRLRKLMELQESISGDILANYIDRTLPVIIDKSSSESESSLAEGRTMYDSPEIDGIVFIDDPDLKTGEIVDVKITAATEHDLEGILIKQSEQ